MRSRAIVGREVEYRDWYLKTHIPELLTLPGFVSAELHQMIAPAGATTEFLCIYLIETTDLPAVQAAMATAGATIVPSPAMDVPATRVEIFEQVVA